MPKGRPRKTDKKVATKTTKQPVNKPNSKPRAKLAGSVVYSIRHQDKRANIPTEELRDFVQAAEQKPAITLYPRDTTLDPQLVWKGKDEQDSKDMAVPSVPVYIQEKIHPQALIENLKTESRRQKTEDEPDLFGDFNGLPDDFDKRVDFYNHLANWQNRMILGDSLLVMNSLAEKEGLKGKVQMIYIDPPYGIKFGSNWQVSTRKRDVKDSKAEDATRQPEQVKAFRDTWELGIHSYLAYMRDRLTMARELLTDTGSVFVQIGDENVHLVRCIMDEVFGSENIVSQITFRKKLMPLGAKTLESMADFILWYAKDKDQVRYRQLYNSTQPDPNGRWTGVKEDNILRRFEKHERNDFTQIPRNSRIFGTVSQWAPSFSANNVFEFSFEGRTYGPALGQCWVTSKEKMRVLGAIGRLFVEGDSPRYVYYHDDFPFSKITNPWDDTAPAQDKTYIVQTNIKVIERCLLMTTDPGDLVLDPTCGSGTTAYVAEQWGRRWITVDTSRVALTLARTRLMSAKYTYFLLADSPEGMMKEAEVLGSTPIAIPPKTNNDIRRGFIYKRVPHITLKSIANNAEIDTIHAKWQEKMEPIRVALNNEMGTKWEEWEVPREMKNANIKIQDLHKQWWDLRLGRQKEIDESISRHAETELLYDQPYEDNKRVRVSGPFTVESLSPHRMLAPQADRPASEAAAQKDASAVPFEKMIIEHLKASGVQNTIKNERLKFERLDIVSSPYYHASGEFLDKTGKPHKVAVFIGPEYGTVGAGDIKDAAKEVVKGIGHEVLIVCGFAFDPHVSEEAKRYGSLTVLITKMNPDLSMGSDLLKKTGAGNLFMVFGEPDIQPVDRKTGRIVPNKDGKVVIEIKGLDVYDPTTGELRSHKTDDIACWFVDTNYNGESFFVRHAYFTGAGDPYERLRKALRAEINESAWSTLYTTKSRPFDKPETGKIAVKMINHYGDEVLKVYDVQ